ncbi:MAG: HEAT repeat domain-containing protein [Acidobacteria bacterium]|nr:HEAT repeat domain-containing protein [Acidobacteriota bacterium]
MALALTLAPVAAVAQPATITNVRAEVRPAGAEMRRVFDEAVQRAAGAAWIGFAAPMTPGDRTMCDWSNRGGRTVTPGPVKLEGPDTLHVLFRVEARRVSRIRVFTEGCVLDGGGLPLTWIDGVASAQGVALLASFVTDAAESRLADEALTGLAFHRDEAAATALIRAARSGSTRKLRGQALFWVAQRAGDKAAIVITEAIDRDPDTEVKKRAVFALSQLPKDEGVPRLITVAREHSNPAVRKQAMFWLGQSNDPRALEFFEKILKP